LSRDHAVVAGGSIAGLVAARVLADHFAAVTIVERDELPAEAVNRKGVPQGRQVHGCLPFGMRIHEQLFPGFLEEVQAAGATKVDFLRDTAWWSPFGWRARAESDLKVLGFTRPLWESQVRQRVLALPNVSVRAARVEGVAASPGGKVVTGLRTGDGDTVEADLVVDATGRGSRARRWLEELGYRPPEEIQVLSHMGYSSRLVRIRDEDLPAEARTIAAFPYPGASRGAGIFSQEDGMFMLYAIGMIKDYPPGDPEQFMAFLGDVPTPLIRAVAERAEPVTDLHTYHMPGNYMRLWHQLEDRPRNLIVTGDAVAAYNPIFGQGISVASMGAKVLDELLDELDDLDELPERFQSEYAKTTTWAFETASSSDMAFPEVELVGVERPAEDGAEYLVQLQQMATVDPNITAALQHAFGNMAIAHLFSDEIRARVEAWVAAGSPVANGDPARIPEPTDEFVTLGTGVI
jgi:2-polyprenyl-6-methoxyphenol hydroxylase-like FAD-dependent oxidoreductase